MRYICAIDHKRKAIVGRLFSDSDRNLESHAQQWTKNGWDVYDCVAELAEDAQTRCLETVTSLSFIHVDITCACSKQATAKFWHG
jgi:hypothetical protein